MTGQRVPNTGGTFLGKITATNASTNLFQVNLRYITAAAPVVLYSGLGYFGEATGQPTNSRFDMVLTAPSANAFVVRMTK